MVFVEQLIEDGKIEPDSGNGRLQEDDDELLDDAIQFTTKTIDDPKYHGISVNIADQPSNEDPSEEIAEGGKA